MAIKNDNLGGTDWSGEALSYVDLNDTFDGTINSGPPIGCVTSWLKNYTNTPSLPDYWVECNGQTLSDPDSPYDGQVIPDLNGDNRFLRGSSTSGSVGGSEEHNHQWYDSGGTWRPDGSTLGGIWRQRVSSGSSDAVFQIEDNFDDYFTENSNTKPPYYEVVWIMRIK